MWAGELRASLSEQDQSVFANARVWPTSILAVEAAINHTGRNLGAGQDGWEGQSITQMVGGGLRLKAATSVTFEVLTPPSATADL